jgi:hypothetical protein
MALTDQQRAELERLGRWEVEMLLNANRKGPKAQLSGCENLGILRKTPRIGSRSKAAARSSRGPAYSGGPLSLPRTSSALDWARGWARVGPMLDFLRLFLHVLVAPFRTQAQLEAEITLLRHQLNGLQRQASTRPPLTTADRLLFVWLCRLFPSLRMPSRSSSRTRCCAASSDG